MNTLATQELQPTAKKEARLARVRIIPRAAAEDFYRPELDVLRFFAFLCVFLYHGLPGLDASQHSGLMARLALYEARIRDAGSFGVCLFFLLSAYLITELLLRERRCTGTVHIRSFYSRRILRIWPLYFVFLFLGVGLSLLMPTYRLEARAVLAFLFLAGNWYTSGHAGALSDSPIWPLWSVSVEEQFYLLWPWIARLGGERWIRRISLTLLAVSYISLYGLARAPAHTGGSAWFSSLVQFQFFALGALLALTLRGRTPRLRPLPRIATLAAGVASWLAANLVFHLDFVGDAPSTGAWVVGYGLVALGSLLLMAGFLGTSPRWLPKPLVYLGKISYGLYVFHMLALNLARSMFWPEESQRAALHTPWGIASLLARALLIVVIGLGGTIALAALSYRFLERPFLNMKERFTFVRSRSV